MSVSLVLYSIVIFPSNLPAGPAVKRRILYCTPCIPTPPIWSYYTSTRHSLTLAHPLTHSPILAYKSLQPPFPCESNFLSTIENARARPDQPPLSICPSINLGKRK
ncbi:hypothetical protein HOY82DRAFT_552703 [Tuber indicum]|nr:hypothetical protein HOY82DRAFT_552703 [Tuber indicum]